MGFAADFRSFALKGNVIDLAVAVVIGKAFGDIVNAVVADVIMPIVGAVMPGGDWRAWSVTPLGLKLGHLLGAMLDFLIIALVLFLVVSKAMNLFKKAEVAPTPTTKPCPECLEVIPLAARRCKSCTAVLTPA
jgi:large conductance mechanosensitive channel